MSIDLNIPIYQPPGQAKAIEQIKNIFAHGDAHPLGWRFEGVGHFWLNAETREIMLNGVAIEKADPAWGQADIYQRIQKFARYCQLAKQDEGAADLLALAAGAAESEEA